MKIFVSAAEISSDLQAEKIIRELISLYPAGEVAVAGIGGPRLRNLPGFQVIEKAENLRAMGFTEVFGKLFTIRRILKRTLLFLEAYQPELILTFDYPDFHFALLKGCAKIPTLSSTVKICGIPPKVWVWRAKRIEKIRRLYHAVWVLFPFEKTLYENAGIPVVFAGNPLIAETLDQALSPKPEWITSSTIRLAVMPGSREAEIKKHLEVIPETLLLLAQKTGKKIIAEIPVPDGIALRRISDYLNDTDQVKYLVSQNASASVLARNSLGLVKSGTSTLEAATLGCVPVIFYRVSFITRLIFQFLIRYEGAVGLPNILLGVKKRNQSIFPELIGPEATPCALSDALLKLIQSPSELKRKQSAGEGLAQSLVPQNNIPLRIAESIKCILDERPKIAISRKSKFSIRLISLLWSSVNYFRRKIQELGFFPPEEISLPSVLIGNLQAGGAGKTPLVILIANAAIRRGYRVGVVSRGYGGNFKSSFLVVGKDQNVELRCNPKVIGDEPVEIFEAVPDVTVGLGADRVVVAKALEKLGINFLIFDDGFQNLKFRAKKTLLAVTDATASEVVFRDFVSQAKRADLVVQTKGMPKQSVVPAIALHWDVADLPKQAIWLLCGVGDPLEVVQFYRNLGVNIDKVIALPDHAQFDFQEVEKWEMQAKSNGAILCITPKDWTKLKSDSSLTPFILRRKIREEDWLETLFKR